MDEKLKKCPFCGGEGEILHYETEGYLPMCSDRLCAGMIEVWFDTEAEAISAWNRRVEG